MPNKTISDNGRHIADQLAGVGQLSKDDFWDLMDTLMDFMENKSIPKIRASMAGAREYAEQKRYQQKNKFGSGKIGDIEVRHLAAIPVPVMLAVKRASMQFKTLPITEEEFYRGFARRYPKYAIPEAI